MEQPAAISWDESNPCRLGVGSAVSCRPPELSVAGEMSDSVLKLEGLGDTTVSTIYSNMEFRFSVQKLAILTRSMNNSKLRITFMNYRLNNTWKYTLKG